MTASQTQNYFGSLDRELRAGIVGRSANRPRLFADMVDLGLRGQVFYPGCTGVVGGH